MQQSNDDGFRAIVITLCHRTSQEVTAMGMGANKMRIEISCIPEDRPVPEFECRLPPSHTSVEVEIIQESN